MTDETGRCTTRTEAEERLARRLYEAMERLDPSDDARAWEELSAQERQFYRLALGDALDDISNLTALHKTDKNVEHGGSEVGEQANLR